MRKRFKALPNDSGQSTYWEVWDSTCDYRYAEFYGDGARDFARNHVKLLNALPKEGQP
jgi:hypothetical protein